MKRIINKIIRKVCILLINTFFSTTNFFKVKNVLLRIAGISVGENSKFVGPIKIGTVANLTIGANSWVGSGLKIYGNGNVVIGDRCDLAPDISFVTGSHEVGDSNRRAGKGTSFTILVGNGCWIGARSTIMGNLIISSSSIIATSSLVNRNVDSNVIVGGVPARVLKEI